MQLQDPTSLELTPIDKSIEVAGGWKMTPLNTMKVRNGDRKCSPSLVLLYLTVSQVFRKDVTNFTSSSDLNPRLLRLEWVGNGEPQSLMQRVVLKGSEEIKFLTICLPTDPIGMCFS